MYCSSTLPEYHEIGVSVDSNQEQLSRPRKQRITSDSYIHLALKVQTVNVPIHIFALAKIGMDVWSHLCALRSNLLASVNTVQHLNIFLELVHTFDDNAQDTIMSALGHFFVFLQAGDSHCLAGPSCGPLRPVESPIQLSHQAVEASTRHAQAIAHLADSSSPWRAVFTLLDTQCTAFARSRLPVHMWDTLKR